MSDLDPSSGPKFSYSTTGGSKKNLFINEMLMNQHSRNLKVWKYLVDHPTDKDAPYEARVYYNKQMDAVTIADQFTYTQHDKDINDQRDHVWITLIHRPSFVLAPYCLVERRCFSLELSDFGAIVEEQPTKGVYDLDLFLRSEYGIKV